VGENTASADLDPKTVPGINFKQETLWTAPMFVGTSRERGYRFREE